MRIALIGYGKMGRIIEQMGRAKGHEFPLIIDLDNREDLISDKLSSADVAIEFTVPASAPDNIMACFDAGIPVVSGTTGWNDRYQEITERCLKMNGGLFHASNFSIGVNIFLELNRQLARIMNGFAQYRVELEEVHHIHKVDAPSGTAITLAEKIIGEIDRIGQWELTDPSSKESKQDEGVLPVRALREGEVKGRHTVNYESEVDSITLTHDAKTREAFASGALMASEFMLQKHGIFGMKDLLGL